MSINEIEKEDDSSDDVESDDQNQFEEFEVDGNEEVKEEEYPYFKIGQIVVADD